MNRKEGESIVNKKVLVWVFLFVLLLVGCLGGPGKLTRIDVQAVDKEMHIQDAEKINRIKSIMKEVGWNANKMYDMSSEEDVKAIFFFDFDKNLPERLVDYKIWWNQSNGSAIIGSSEKEEGYGTLDKKYSKELEKELMEDF